MSLPFAPADDDRVVAADQGFLEGQEPLLRGRAEFGAFVGVEGDQVDLGLAPLWKNICAIRLTLELCFELLQNSGHFDQPAHDPILV